MSYAPGYKWPYNFHVVGGEDINAFALPGGSIFVNLGTIQAAETEAQLAGVMAHEISHGRCKVEGWRSRPRVPPVVKIGTFVDD